MPCSGSCRSARRPASARPIRRCCRPAGRVAPGAAGGRRRGGTVRRPDRATSVGVGRCSGSSASMPRSRSAIIGGRRSSPTSAPWLPSFQLAAQDRRVVLLRQRRPAERQRQQQDAERIDVVGDACRRRGRRDGTWRYRVARTAPAGASPAGAAQAAPSTSGWPRWPSNTLFRPDGAVGDAARGELLQRQRDRPQDVGDQRGLGPGTQPAGERRPGRRGADDEIAGFAARAERRTVAERASARRRSGWPAFAAARARGGRSRRTWMAISAVSPVWRSLAAKAGRPPPASGRGWASRTA